MLSDCRESTSEKPQSLGSSEDSHFESENPFGMRELETREHWYFQWPNLPQAKRLPCLEGKSERPKGKEQKWRSYCRRSGRPKIGTRRSRSGRIMLRRFLRSWRFKSLFSSILGMTNPFSVFLSIGKLALNILLNGLPTKFGLIS